MSSPKNIYLDYAATTPVDPRVAAAMADCLAADGFFGNPSSIHAFGVAARERVEKAREQVARLIGADPAGIVWTSGATEADNLALLGGARYHAPRGRHLVTTRVEHKAVLDACKQLEKEGFKVTYLKPGADGAVTVEQVAAALTAQTTLVSVMHVNNETGAVADIGGMGRVCRERGVLFHVDAAQSAGRLAIDVEAQGIDLLSLSAHKVYGPKGVGALYVRRKPPVGLAPLMFGGGQEEGLRPGTLPTHQIVGMGLACELAAAEREIEAQRLEGLRDRLWRRLEGSGRGLLNNSCLRERTDFTPHRASAPGEGRVGEEETGHKGAPHILNVSFEGVEGESLLMGIQGGGLAVSSGAACSSASQEASYVLRALGRGDALAQASLRFSLGRFTTEAEVDGAVEIVGAQVARLRGLSPATAPPLAGKDVLQGEAGSVEQGTWVRFCVRVDGTAVTEVRFQLYGCPDTFRVAQWLVARVLGRPVGGLLTESPREWALMLQIPPAKLGRLLVLEDALRKIAPA